MICDQLLAPHLRAGIAKNNPSGPHAHDSAAIPLTARGRMVLPTGTRTIARAPIPPRRITSVRDAPLHTLNAPGHPMNREVTNDAKENRDPMSAARKAIAPPLRFSAADHNANGARKKVRAISMSPDIVYRAVSLA